MGEHGKDHHTPVDTGEIRILTLKNLFDRVDWSLYDFTVSDDTYKYRCVLLHEAFYGQDQHARIEAMFKLGDVYIEAKNILKKEGLGYFRG